MPHGEKIPASAYTPRIVFTTVNMQSSRPGGSRNRMLRTLMDMVRLWLARVTVAELSQKKAGNVEENHHRKTPSFEIARGSSQRRSGDVWGSDLATQPCHTHRTRGDPPKLARVGIRFRVLAKLWSERGKLGGMLREALRNTTSINNELY